MRGGIYRGKFTAEQHRGFNLSGVLSAAKKEKRWIEARVGAGRWQMDAGSWTLAPWGPGRLWRLALAGAGCRSLDPSQG